VKDMFEEMIKNGWYCMTKRGKLTDDFNSELYYFFIEKRLDLFLYLSDICEDFRTVFEEVDNNNGIKTGVLYGWSDEVENYVPIDIKDAPKIVQKKLAKFY
jgi:hypothetical protein